MVPLPIEFVEKEMDRKIALECGQRCFDYKEKEYHQGEQLCFARCVNKYRNMRSVVDMEIKKSETVEQPLCFG